MGDPDTLAETFPLTFIIGAMKCGTTSLFNHLAKHPEIAPCSIKEPDFFCRESVREEDLSEYLSLWNWQEGVHKIAIEASANYSKIPSNVDCAAQIARFPEIDARFIYCMRNPFDRIPSHAYHGLYANWTKPLEQGISDHLINCSKYAMQLDAYTARFDRNRILLVVLEEFQQAPEQQLRRIFRFMGVDPEFAVPELDQQHNTAQAHYIDHPAWKWLKRFGSARALARLVPESLRRTLRSRSEKRLDARRTLTASEKTMVLARLASDLKRLRSVYGIDCKEVWGIDPEQAP